MIRLTLTTFVRDGLPWEAAAVPSEKCEKVLATFKSIPGVRWRWDDDSSNGAGYYVGDATAIDIAAAMCEAAGLAEVRGVIPTTHAASTDDDLLPELRDYQRGGAAWLRYTLATTNGALLADDMGLGKSIQTLGATAEFCGRDRQRVIVCPAIAVQHWERQITLWAREFGTHQNLEEMGEAPTRKAERLKWQQSMRLWRVMSYESFTSCWAELDPSMLVFDEIHYLANSKSQRGKAASAWRAAHPTVPVIGLSGTPLVAKVSDLWHVLEVLWPGRFGSFFNFTKRYAAGHYREIKVGAFEKLVWMYDGRSNSAELARRLAPCMLRRTKADVALELPSRIRTVHEIEMSAAASKALSSSMTTLQGSLVPGRHMRVAAALSYCEEHKVEAAVTLAKDVIAAGGKPLVLVLRKATGQRIESELTPLALAGHAVARVDGDDAAAARVAALQAADIGIATLDSVTTGIDLVNFDHCIFVGLDWLPSKMLQGESRIHRIGQARSVHVHYLVALGTIDEAVREAVIDRLEMFEAVAGKADADLSATLRGGSPDELISQIANLAGADWLSYEDGEDMADDSSCLAAEF